MGVEWGRGIEHKKRKRKKLTDTDNSVVIAWGMRMGEGRIE